MGIKVIEGLQTTRSFPRLMRNTQTNAIVLFGDNGGVGIIMTGDEAGRSYGGVGINWDNLEDLKGSVTVHNTD